MTREALKNILYLYMYDSVDMEHILSCVDKYCAESNSGKPIVSGSLPPDDVLMKVIEVLDEYGRDVDVYEYGLPMNLDVDKQEMLQRIKNVLGGNDR